MIREPSDEYGTDHRIDLSGIAFEALKTRFEQDRKHTEAERVKGVVALQLRKMVRLNRTRMDYLERFQRMIDEYNSGSVNVEHFTKNSSGGDQGNFCRNVSPEPTPS